MIDRMLFSLTGRHSERNEAEETKMRADFEIMKAKMAAKKLKDSQADDPV